MLEKQKRRHRRHKRISARIRGNVNVPRLCVSRSSKHMYVQLIENESGKTLAVASDRDLKPNSKAPKIKTQDSKSKEGVSMAGKVAVAFEVGRLIAKKAQELKIEKVVFDRAGYAYHGRVKALAEGARDGGLKF